MVSEHHDHLQLIVSVMPMVWCQHPCKYEPPGLMRPTSEIIPVWPLLEYVYPVWHTSLTKEQYCKAEQIQKRAMKIILSFDSNCTDFENFCLVHILDTLEACQAEMCKSFFINGVINESSCLHYLLASPHADASYTLRHQSKFASLIVRTTRFSNSFIMYGLKNYHTAQQSLYVQVSN